jgi:hypothetical protein
VAPLAKRRPAARSRLRRAQQLGPHGHHRPRRRHGVRGRRRPRAVDEP